MKKTRTIAAKLSGNRCPERGCVVLDQPQHVLKFWCSGFFHALRLVFDTATLLSVAITTASLLMLRPASAHAQGGIPLWTNRYNGPANGEDLAHAIAVGSSGNVFVTGGSYDPGGMTFDIATVAYSNSGVPLWTNYYEGGSFDSSVAIATDREGNVFVTGFSWNGSINSDASGDYVTIKYSIAGVPLWTRRFGRAASEASQIAVDSSGNVFVTGQSSDNTTPLGITVAYSSAGVPLWTNRFNGDASFSVKVAVDRAGNVFVTGSGTNSDYLTIKYSSSVPPPRLDFQLLNNQLVLNWTNAGFNLQTAPAVTGPFTNLPAATSPYTNALIGPQQFFRLISN